MLKINCFGAKFDSHQNIYSTNVNLDSEGLQCDVSWSATVSVHIRMRQIIFFCVF